MARGGGHGELNERLGGRSLGAARSQIEARRELAEQRGMNLQCMCVASLRQVASGEGGACSVMSSEGGARGEQQCQGKKPL